MERRVSATEARVHFGALMRRVVERDEPAVVEKAGEPQVVVISFAEYQRLKGQPDQEQRMEAVRRVLDFAAELRRENPNVTFPPPEEVIHAGHRDPYDVLEGEEGDSSDDLP